MFPHGYRDGQRREVEGGNSLPHASRACRPPALVFITTSFSGSSGVETPEPFKAASASGWPRYFRLSRGGIIGTTT